MSASPVLERMHALLDHWSAEADRRDVFLRCYAMMTANMHAAVDRGEFEDRPWVELLLRRFAEYYFDALRNWEAEPETAPRAWQLAHASTRDGDATVLQLLLLGVNAHINYDLVLTVHEVLEEEWHAMTMEQRARRFDDYCRVNAIISATIDAVQDEVISPAMPVSAILDRLMGRLDEYMISRLVSSWRDHTWHDAVQLLESSGAGARRAVVAGVEARALRMAARIGPLMPDANDQDVDVR